MRLSWKDGLATLFVAVATAIYSLWLSGAAFAGISTRAVGAIVLALGWAACTSDAAALANAYGTDNHPRPQIALVVISSVLGGVALVAGVITLIGSSETMLGALVVAMIALWMVATARHVLGSIKGRETANRESLGHAA
jgi:hypothetical protein